MTQVLLPQMGILNMTTRVRLSGGLWGWLGILLPGLLLMMVAPVASAAVQPELGVGMMLVSTDKMSDRRFSRTVILLIEQGDRGSMGLVLNKPSEVSLGFVLPDFRSTEMGKQKLYLGGPMQTSNIFSLVRTDQVHPSMRKVFGNVYAAAGLRALGHIAGQLQPTERLRGYAGYAGWAPGQLKREVEQGVWQLVPADEESVFEAADGLWERLSKGKMKWV